MLAVRRFQPPLADVHPAWIASFVQYNRDQTFWLHADDLAHFVVAAMERLPPSAFPVKPQAAGQPQYHPRRIKEAWRLAMQAKLETEDAQALYSKCTQTLELAFGIIKSVMALRRVASKWLLIALARHCM